MPALLGLVFSRGGLIVMAVLALLGVFGVQALRLAHANAVATSARAEAKLARADLQTCQTNEAALKAHADAQERAVGALKAQSEAWVAQSARARSQALSSAQHWQARAAQIAAERAGTTDLCQAAERVLREPDQ